MTNTILDATLHHLQDIMDY